MKPAESKLSSSKCRSSLDAMQARLHAMLTEYTLTETPCRALTLAIRDQLQVICEHPEISFFPDQRFVFIKMLGLWRARAANVLLTHPPAEQYLRQQH